jgi:hypothetical protein
VLGTSHRPAVVVPGWMGRQHRELESETDQSLEVCMCRSCAQDTMVAPSRARQNGTGAAEREDDGAATTNR